MNAATANTLGALAFATLLLAGTRQPPPDNSSEWQQAEQLQAEHRQAERDAAAHARTERAAAAICAETHGPNAAHRWTPDGAVVCSNKHGKGVRRARVEL